jgi:hypothetical protein
VTAKSPFSSVFSAIDNPLDLLECVQTQIKRAYELSVCIDTTLLQNPDYRADGCAWSEGVAAIAEPLHTSVRRVLFSFHIVEIS